MLGYLHMQLTALVSPYNDLCTGSAHCSPTSTQEAVSGRSDTRLYDLAPTLVPTKKAKVDPAVTRQRRSPGTPKTWMASLSLEVETGPAKASIASGTAHLEEACKHTRGLCTC